MARPTLLGRDPGTLPWAIAWDLVLGEQAAGVDPRLAVDHATDALEGAAPQRSRLARGLYGAAIALLLPCAAWTAARWLLALTARIHRSLYQEAAILLLKASVSIRPTAEEALTVEREPSRGLPPLELPSPSQRLTRLAQGLTGNVVGPLFYFALLGVPGALAYRALRALRDRWGPRAEDPLGTVATKLEGMASFAPARLGALLLAGGARLSGGNARAAWETSRLEARRARQPNEGWTEGALAGALGVRLDRSWGPPVNEGGRSPEERDLAQAQHLFYIAAGGAVGAALAITALRHVARRR